MRLIDADALLNQIYNLSKDTEEYYAILELITNAPTIEPDSGEAVAWMNPNAKDTLSMLHWTKNEYYSQPLYTSPQKRAWVDLTDEQIIEIFKQDLTIPKQYAKAIQAKLKEVNHG